MGHVLVWGNLRGLIDGELPQGVPAQEVETLASLVEKLEARPSPLVLLDPAKLEAEAEAFETWHTEKGAELALFVAVSTNGHAEDVLQRFSFLDDAVPGPVRPGLLKLRLTKAFDAVHSRRIIRQLEGTISRKGRELHELNKIGVALSAERDIDKLLETILLKSREITAADAGSLYLVERPAQGQDGEPRLRFELAQNDSVSFRFEAATMPLDDSSIAGYAALTGQGVNVADAYELPPGYPFRIGRSFDQKSGYRTRSMLVVPMRDHQNQVIGVVQLINKKRDPNVVLRPVAVVEEAVVPFTSVDEELVTSLASQAAVAFENSLLIVSIKNLFDAFVRASVTAIEQRDPTTSGHSNRVAVLTVGLAEKVDALNAGEFRDIRFTKDQLQEIRYASLLHDFGKVGVREKVLIKGKKLYVGEMLLVRQRFAYIRRSLEADHFRSRIEKMNAGAGAAALAEMDYAYAARLAEVDSIQGMLAKANEPTVLDEGNVKALQDLPSRTYVDLDGTVQPYLTPEEVAALSIRRGSLSERERREIESHVTHTYRFLSQIPWTGEYRSIPDIAYAHHEKLDGTGYPRGLQAPQIPVQSRMMTIADIFDALVAWDRPYKKAVAVERALDILKDEADLGKIDKPLLDIFLDARIYERTLRTTADGAA